MGKGETSSHALSEELVLQTRRFSEMVQSAQSSHRRAFVPSVVTSFLKLDLPPKSADLDTQSFDSVGELESWLQSKGRQLTATELEQWLKQRGQNTTGWGEGTSKAVEALLAEIQKKESTLVFESKRVLRCLEVAKVRVQRPGSSDYLIEAKQIMSTGRERTREQVLAEKVFAGETAKVAANRGVNEEILTPLGLPELQPDSACEMLHNTVEIKLSDSYPGLMSRYTFHEVCALAACRGASLSLSL